MSKPDAVSAAAPRLPPLRSDLLDPWITRCVSRFRTSGITSGSTKVDYAVNCLPDDVMIRLQFDPIYSAENPWDAFVASLRSVLGEDPQAAVSRIMRDNLDTSDPLIRLAELNRLLDSTPDVKTSLIKWSLMCMLQDQDHESFWASHNNKSVYDFAKEASLLLARRSASGSINASYQKHGNRNSGTNKDKLCFYHKKFGSKATHCRKYPACPPLVASVENEVGSVLNVLQGEIPSSDSSE